MEANVIDKGSMISFSVYITLSSTLYTVWRPAPGPVNTRGHAIWPAQRLAIVCHVTNVALGPYRVAIDVQEFVAI